MVNAVGWSSSRLALMNAVRIFFFLIFSKGLASDPAVASVGKLRSSAEQALSKGDVSEALKLWEQVIAIEPNDSNFYKRFRVYLRQQKLKEALSDLNKALEINPKHENALVYMLYAICYTIHYTLYTTLCTTHYIGPAW